MANEPHSAPTSPPILLPALRNLLAFTLGLAAVCFTLNAQLPTMPVFEIALKLDHLQAHRFDTVFIGSSRVYHAFDPPLFDRELAARGHSSRSFNFGINGMRPPESLYVLRQVLKMKLPLRWVFIELGDINPKVNPANIGSARYLHWHDLQHTTLVLRHIVASRSAPADKWQQALVHATCFLARSSNIGRGPGWLGVRLLGPQKPGKPVIPWAGHEGFEPESGRSLTGARLAAYEAAVALVAQVGLPQNPVPPVVRGALQDIVAEVRASGAEPVFVISPTVVRNENLADLEGAGIHAPVIAFTDPQRHPGVFLSKHHSDEQHLNAAGAAEFTRALAEEFAPRAR